MIAKSKPYKEITLLWPNVARMVKDAEGFLNKLSCQEDHSSFVQQCAIKAAKKASEIEYTDDYTYRKLTTFCDEFKKNRVSGFECVFCPMTGALQANTKPDFGVALLLMLLYIETGLWCVYGGGDEHVSRRGCDGARRWKPDVDGHVWGEFFR